MNKSKEKLSILFGGLTVLLFAMTPYIVDFIEPAKSIGQVIGENAKDLVDVLKGEKQIESNSKRDIWINIFTILGYLSFAITIIMSLASLNDTKKKWYAIPGILLAVLGLGIHLSYLAIGFIALVIIALLIIALIHYLDAI